MFEPQRPQPQQTPAPVWYDADGNPHTGPAPASTAGVRPFQPPNVATSSGLQPRQLDDPLKDFDPDKGGSSGDGGWFGSIKRFVGGVFDTAVVPMIQTVVIGLQPDRMSIVGPQIAESHLDQFRKSKDKWDEARKMPEGSIARNALTLESIAHAVAGSVPLMGPALAATGEKIGKGDIAGGTGETVGLLLPFGLRPGLKFAGVALSEHGVPGVIPGSRLARTIDAAGPILQRTAETKLARTIAPVTGANKVRLGAKAVEAAPEILSDESMTAWSRATLHEKVETAHKAAQEALNEFYKQLPEKDRLDLRPVIEAIEAKRRELVVEGVERVPGVAEDVQGKTKGPRSVGYGIYDETARDIPATRIKAPISVEPANSAERLRAIDTALDELRQFGPEGMVSPSNLRKLAMAWGQGARDVYAKAVGPDYLKTIGRGLGWADAEQALRDYLSDKVPGIKALNDQYHLFRSVSDVMTAATEAELVRPVAGRRTGEAVAGAVIGGYTGGVLGATIGAVVGPVIDAAITNGVTTQIKVARVMSRVATAIRKGQGARAEAAIVDAARAGGEVSVLQRPAMTALRDAFKALKESSDTGSVPGQPKPESPFSHGALTEDVNREFQAFRNTHPKLGKQAALDAFMKLREEGAISRSWIVRRIK